MKPQSLKLGLVALGSTLALPAMSQVGWDAECIDTLVTFVPPDQNWTNAFSDDWTVGVLNNRLFRIAMGGGGTVTYGGPTPGNFPCFTQGAIGNDGKFALSNGDLASIQHYSDNFEDDDFAMTFGAPFSPLWVFANTRINGTLAYLGNQPGDFFGGVSNRYLKRTCNLGTVLAELQIELVADAARIRWRFTNNTNATINMGYLFGGCAAMVTSSPAFRDDNDVSQAGGFGGIGNRNAKPVYVYVPNQKSPTTDRVYDRTLDPGNFPPYVDLLFGQSESHGIHLENDPSEQTDDTNPLNKPNRASQFYLGKASLNGGFPGILDALNSAAPTFQLNGLRADTSFQGQTAWIQVFPDETISPGTSRQFLHYLKGTWGNGDYSLPFGATVDAPHRLTYRTSGFAGGGNQELIAPNPFPVRVYADNVGGFAFDEKEFPLIDVRIRLKFEEGRGVTVQGLSEKTIPLINPRDLDFVDFTAVADEFAEGDIGYTVTIDSQPGNLHKEIKGTFNVAGTPRVTLSQDANLVTFPFRFTDTSLDAILEPFRDPNVPGGNYQAFAWDAEQKGYVVTTTAERGHGQFVIYDNASKAPIRRVTGGNPTVPNDYTNDIIALQLSSGWNLIANPFHVRIPIKGIIGVAADSNETAYSFAELVSLGLISNFVAYYDPAIQDYQFVDGSTGYLEPNRGYWILVLASGQVSILYPTVYEPWVPGTNLKTVPNYKWTQSDKQWRLQVIARDEKNLDAENFVGLASSATEAKKNRMFEPPQRPNQDLAAYVVGTVDGKPTNLAQSLSEKSARMEWKLVVDTKKTGQVVLTWPNVSTVPKNMRFRITDVATGIARDLRQTSGYSFNMDKAGTREFLIEATPGGVSRAIIGDVNVSRPNSKDRNSPFTVNFTLASDATTTVRVLDGRGKEVFTVVRGKMSKAGQNNVVWALKDNANRAVAPGTYRLEILAETPDGERVRKVVPVNVIR